MRLLLSRIEGITIKKCAVVSVLVVAALVVGTKYDFEFFPEKVGQPLMSYKKCTLTKVSKSEMIFTQHDSITHKWDSKRHLQENGKDLGKYLLFIYKESNQINWE